MDAKGAIVLEMAVLYGTDIMAQVDRDYRNSINIKDKQYFSNLIVKELKTAIWVSILGVSLLAVTEIFDTKYAAYFGFFVITTSILINTAKVMDILAVLEKQTNL